MPHLRSQGREEAMKFPVGQYTRVMRLNNFRAAVPSRVTHIRGGPDHGSREHIFIFAPILSTLASYAQHQA